MPNSLAQTGDFTCPQCAQPFQADVWLIVDAVERPDLVQQMRDGELHLIACPHCAQRVGVDAPLLIYLAEADAAAGRPPLLFSPAAQTSAEQDQEQGIGLLSTLAQTLGAAWQDAWLEQAAVVPRRLLPAALSDDPQAALAALQAELAAEEPDVGIDEAATGSEADAGDDDQPAWEEGLRSLLHLLEQFVQTRSWDESQRIVTAHPQLLDEATDDVLTALIAQAEQNGDGAVEILTEHRDLLRRCREAGVARAFAEKILPPEELAEAERLGMAPEAFVAAMHQGQQMPPELRAVLAELAASSGEIHSAQDLEAALAGRPDLRARLEAAADSGPQMPPELADDLQRAQAAEQQYRRTGDLAALDVAIAAWSTILDSPALAAAGQRLQLAVLNNAGGVFLRRHWARGRMEDLDHALECWQRAVQETPSGSPDLPSRLNNLGNGLRDRYSRTGQLADLEEAVRSYRAACTLGALGAPNEVLNAARNWGNWALQRRVWQEAAEACQHGLATGRLLLARHWGRAQKGAWLRELQTMPALLAYALARLGRLEEAVAAAEGGRARLLGEALERTRRDLDLLPSRGHADLLARYQAVVQQLDRLTRSEAPAPDAAGALSGPERLAAITAANAEFDAVAAAIRAVDGYGDFLVEPTFAQIAPLSHAQPLVYLLASEAGGLALIVHAGVVQPLRLDDLSEEKLDALLLVREEDSVTGGYLVGQLGDDAQLRQHLPPLLTALGELVAQPLAAALHSLPGNPSAVLLIPSGRLALLPLHAAPLADGRTLQDAFAVRYAPSALAAAAAEHRPLPTGQRPLPAGQRPLLALGNPRGPQTAPALFTDWLARRAATALGAAAPLLFERAGVQAVRAQLAAGSPAQLLFGCHGIFETAAPLDSGLELADGRLTLAQLLDEVRLDGVDLVTLCACQTAIADFNDLSNEAIGLPAAFLQAGARRVVGTLWPVHALATVLLLDHFYALLAAGVRAEQATAEAAAWLRTLPRAGAQQRLQEVISGAQAVSAQAILACEALVQDPLPFAHPMYWAAFTTTGAAPPAA